MPPATDSLRKDAVRVLGQHALTFFERRNPAVKARTNAVNARLRAADGWVRMLVDLDRAPEVVKDLEQVVAIEGSSGEIDKRRDPMRSHVSDALGYYVAKRFPLRERRSGSSAVLA